MARLKDDEVRFRHACSELPRGTVEQIAARAQVPLHRARNLYRRWQGASSESLPPLPDNGPGMQPPSGEGVESATPATEASTDNQNTDAAAAASESAAEPAGEGVDLA
jgi:hypothetical protein